MTKKGEKQQNEDNPERIQRQLTIASLRLDGKSVAEIAREIGMSKATVSRELQKEHIKTAIEDTVSYLASFHPVVERGHVELLISDDPAVRQRAIDSWYKVMGAMGPQAPQYIQNILAVQGNVVMTPQLQKLITHAFSDDIIDVTPYEDTTRPKSNEQDGED